MLNLAIDAKGISKRFSTTSRSFFSEKGEGRLALDRVDFAVPWGQTVGLMGPNGAGKTSLIKILCTLIVADEGSATVAGHPLTSGAAIRSEVGLVVTDERSFYWRLTGRQNLLFFAALHRQFGIDARQRADHLLQQLNLSDVADLRFDRYSSGMKQRLSIARALLHQPRILFLDEPGRSLDQTEKERLHQWIRRLKEEEGLTSVVVTHDQQEAAALCDDVVILAHGIRQESSQSV
ncbi:MAG: ABC transporter ATP-binding protein [Chloroflexota bacterium]